ncbi:MAG TPA: VOC family protein [Acidimicrobiales bacterium]|nr:VOC family protein [Acidimicrobiales bacterium]
MTGIRFGSVSLDSDDPARLADFWANLLGGAVAFSGDDFVAVKLANLWLTAVRVGNYVAPSWPSDEVAKQIHLDLAVDDLESATATAIGFGATQPDHQPGDGSYVVMLDPAGHPFCLTTQIPED